VLLTVWRELRRNVVSGPHHDPLSSDSERPGDTPCLREGVRHHCDTPDRVGRRNPDKTYPRVRSAGQ